MRRTPKEGALALVPEPLYRDIRAVLDSARASAYRAVNTVMVQRTGNRQRAAYGEAVLEDLSHRLTDEFGRGFDVTNLRKMRQSYRMFEIRDAVRLESAKANARSRCSTTSG